MGRWTAESTGMAVLRPIAKEHLKKPELRSRVWSDELGSWGMFSKDANDLDEFIIWCSLEPGDRLALGGKDIHTVIGIWKEISEDIPVWLFKLINSNGQITDLAVPEQQLFKKAWGAL